MHHDDLLWSLAHTIYMCVFSLLLCIISMHGLHIPLSVALCMCSSMSFLFFHYFSESDDLSIISVASLYLANCTLFSYITTCIQACVRLYTTWNKSLNVQAVLNWWVSRSTWVVNNGRSEWHIATIDDEGESCINTKHAASCACTCRPPTQFIQNSPQHTLLKKKKKSFICFVHQ